MEFTPAQVRLNGIDVYCGLADGGRGRLRLRADPGEWPGYGQGRRVRLQRGRGDEWFAVESVARVAGVVLAVLSPADPRAGRFPFARFRQTLITSLGVLRVRPNPGPEGEHADVNCPVCGSRQVERFMRVSVYMNDIMKCDRGHYFVAADIPGMWK